jgi:hypothetical protein
MRDRKEREGEEMAKIYKGKERVGRRSMDWNERKVGRPRRGWRTKQTGAEPLVIKKGF